MMYLARVGDGHRRSPWSFVVNTMKNINVNINSNSSININIIIAFAEVTIVFYV